MCVRALCSVCTMSNVSKTERAFKSTSFLNCVRCYVLARLVLACLLHFSLSLFRRNLVESLPFVFFLLVLIFSTECVAHKSILANDIVITGAVFSVYRFCCCTSQSFLHHFHCYKFLLSQCNRKKRAQIWTETSMCGAFQMAKIYIAVFLHDFFLDPFNRKCFRHFGKKTLRINGCETSTSETTGRRGYRIALSSTFRISREKAEIKKRRMLNAFIIKIQLEFNECYSIMILNRNETSSCARRKS